MPDRKPVITEAIVSTSQSLGS